MRGVFNPDSPMMRALGVVWDLIVLNLLFLVCCIPVVTIGPAITALHYVTTKMAGEKDGTPVVGNFFKSFRANFRQGVLMGILFGAAGGFLGYDIYLLWHSGNFQNSIFKILIPVAAIAYMMTFVYAFPLLARFNNTVLGTIRNAFIMSVTSLPQTFSMLLLIGACVALTLYTQTTLRYGLFLWFALGFSSIAYANASVLNGVFMKCSEQYSSQINQEQSQDTTEITFKRVAAMGDDVHIDSSEEVLKRLTYVGDVNVLWSGNQVFSVKAATLHAGKREVKLLVPTVMSVNGFGST